MTSSWISLRRYRDTKYARGFVVLYFVVIISRDPFTHILQGCFTSTEAIARLPRCKWRNTEGCGQNPGRYLTTIKHHKPQNLSIYLFKYCLDYFEECFMTWLEIYTRVCVIVYMHRASFLLSWCCVFVPQTRIAGTALSSADVCRKSAYHRSIAQHWNGIVDILIKFSSLASP